MFNLESVLDHLSLVIKLTKESQGSNQINPVASLFCMYAKSRYEFSQNDNQLENARFIP